jgi:DNA-binding CsgD family transcriptional regulator
VIRTSLEVKSPVVRAGLESLLRGSDSIQLTDVEPEVLVSDGSADPHGVPAVVLADSAAVGGDVRGALPAEASRDEILAAIQAVAAGLLVLHPNFADTLPVRHASIDLPEPLTPRETEVLRLLAEGVGNKEIAWRLGISEHTVKFHVAQLLDKLNAGSRTEAVTIGIRAGLVMV